MFDTTQACVDDSASIRASCQQAFSPDTGGTLEVRKAVAARTAGAAAVLALLGLAWATEAQAQSVIVAIDSSRATVVGANLSGANVNASDSPENFADPAVRAFVKPLRPALLRWPGGTVDDVFDGSAGTIHPPGVPGHPSAIDIERGIFQPFPAIAFGQTVQRITSQAQPILAARGGNPIGDAATGFAGLANAVGAKLVVVVNAVTDTVAAAQQLAFTVAQRKLPVTAFELTNEPFFVAVPTSAGPIKLPAGAPNVAGAFTDGVDYLTKMKPYYDAIKQGYAAAGLSPAQAVVAIAGGYAGEPSAWNVQWARDMATYTSGHGAYWDAVAFHFYPAQATTGSTFTQSMSYANDGLAAGTDAFIAGYRAARWSAGKPLIVTEYGVTMSDRVMNGSLYAGIVGAEYVARLSAYPETAGVMLHELFNTYDGIGVPDTAIDGTGDWQATLIAAGQAGRTVDTTGRIKGMFYNAEILGTGVADAAVNVSDLAYATKATGQVGTVATRSGTVPAFYAQAYHGRDGSVHVLVTNKGPDSKIVSLVLNGQTVTASVSAYAIHPSAGDPSERNSATAQTVTVQHSTVKGAVTIPGYSVTHLRFVAA